MGLFDFLKKKEPEKTQPAKPLADSKKEKTEFERDIEELLARDDITCRPEICEAEYQKAMSLLEKPSQSTVQRAYDIMGNLASQFDYVPAIMWMGDFMESVQKNPSQARFWFKKAADLGSGDGARNYADMLMAGVGGAPDQRTAISYYAMAADKGVPEAAFVMGEFLRSTGDRANALKAYQQAASAGYQPAQMRIQQMKSGR